MAETKFSYKDVIAIIRDAILHNYLNTIEIKFDANGTKVTVKRNGKEIGTAGFRKNSKSSLANLYREAQGKDIDSGNPARMQILTRWEGNPRNIPIEPFKINEFGQFCGYLFEWAFFAMFYFQQPDIAKKTLLSAYNAAKRKGDGAMRWGYENIGKSETLMIYQTMRKNSYSIMQQIKAENDAKIAKTPGLSGQVIVPHFSTKANAPDDIVLVIGDSTIRLDLKSYAASSKSRLVEWIKYGSISENVLGIRPIFLDYLKNRQKQNGYYNGVRYWGGNLKDEEWAEFLTDNDFLSVYWFTQNIRTDDFFKTLLIKGKKVNNNYLKEKRLVVQSRTNKTGEDWTVEMTLDMQTLVDLLNKKERLALSFKEISNNPFGRGYWGIFEGGTTNKPYAAFQIPTSNIAEKGHDASHGKEVPSKKLPIAFILNHNFYGMKN